MNRGTANSVLAGIFAVGLAGFGFWLWSTRETVPAAGETGRVEPLVAGSVQLMFPGPGNLLHTEDRLLDTVGEDGSLLATLVETLLAGPNTEGLFRPFPDGTELSSILVTRTGTAFVDLMSREGAPPLSSGSTEELLNVYSVVNSVLVNAPEVRGVVLLWNGQHRPTLAGHVDLTRPLILNRSLIAASAEALSGT
ncbi:MAG: GerMN domain-containing protein [Acidobacteriota bacterium]|nr:GerMN domain-containing protein [Acidobacteriota bacterium]